MTTNQLPARVVLNNLAADLDAAGVFASLPIEDGELLIAALSFDVWIRNDPSAAMRARADAVRQGRWPCRDRDGVACALDAAASLLSSAA